MTVYATYQEIVTQSEALLQALESVQQQGDRLRADFQVRRYQQVIFTGCGSTYYLSLAAASLFQTLTRIPAVAIPAGEALLNPALLDPRPLEPTLLVVFSRSGTTSESVRAVHAFVAAGHGDVLTITCTPGNTLSQMGKLNIVIPAAQEQSVTQTRAFSAMWVAACAFAGVVAGNHRLLEQLRQLPDIVQSSMKQWDENIAAVGADLSWDHAYFLGSGFRYGLACEASLKMKEMSLTHVEAFHFLEFRHGPKSMVTNRTLIVGLPSDDPQGYERDVLRDVADLGARVLTFGRAASKDGAIWSVGSELDEFARSALVLPPIQLLALYRAIAKGLNPDQPRNLTAVVYLSSES